MSLIDGVASVDQNGVFSGRDWYRVENPAGSGSLKKYNAIIDSSVPQVGTNVSGVVGGKYIGARTQSIPNEPEHIKVEVSWTTDPNGLVQTPLSLGDPDEITVDRISIQEETRRNAVTGDILTTTYTPNLSLPQTFNHVIPVDRAGVIYNITKTLDFSVVNFRTLVADYADHVNSVIWGGYNPTQVLCIGFAISQYDVVNNYARVKGVFAPSPAKDQVWTVKLWTKYPWYNEATDPEPTDGNGIETEHVYPVTDLNNSGFIIPW